MRIGFIADVHPYVRNRIILEGLKLNNVKVVELTTKSKSNIFRYFIKLNKFLLSNKKDYDLIFVGFVGQPIVPIIRKITDKPIIFDAYMSLYDTICLDKGKIKPNSLVGKILYKLDKSSCQAADIVLLDTSKHADFFRKEFGVNKNKLRRVLVGAEDRLFYPRLSKRKDGKFIVEFHGSFIPLQGTEYIIMAAKILEKYDDIHFDIVGAGQTFEYCKKLAEDLKLANITFEGWRSYNEMPYFVANADVCLGIFGKTLKSQNVIATKSYEIIAMKKPLITAETVTSHELFQNRKDVLYCKSANAKSLAAAILELRNNKKLRKKIAENGYRLFKAKCTPKAIGKDVKEIAIKLLKQKKA